METFQERIYVRPDRKQYKKQLQNCVATLEDARSYQAARDILLTKEQCDAAFLTSYTLCQIRAGLAVDNAFYAGELAYFDKTFSKLRKEQNKWIAALLESPYRPLLADEFGEHFFRLLELDERLQDTRAIRCQMRENRLRRRYQKLIASAKIRFRKKPYTICELQADLQHHNPKIRRGAARTLARFYQNLAPQLDSLLNHLVRNRTQMAKKLGFKNYTSVAYRQLHRTDYAAKDIAKFRAAVRKYVVPACLKLRELQKRRMKLDDLCYADEAAFIAEGNPLPSGNAKDYLAVVTEMFHALSPKADACIDAVLSQASYHLAAKQNKCQDSFCALLPDTGTPFLFGNLGGTASDIELLTWLTGQAFALYSAAQAKPLAVNRVATGETAALHGAAMTYFSYPWMERFFGDTYKDFLSIHICNALFSIAHAACADAFQHRLYENPRATSQQRRALWKQLEQVYLPWRHYDGELFFESGGMWMQNANLFLRPFCDIDTALAQVGALELFFHMLKAPEQTWRDYMRLCAAGGSLPYARLRKLANLSNPFDASVVEAVTSGVLAILTPRHTNREERATEP